MKTKSKLLGIVIIALIITSSVSSLVNFSNAGGPNSSYTINLTSINGQPLDNGPFSNPVTLLGAASGTNFVGQLTQCHVQVTWGDGIIEVIPVWIFLTQTGEDFEGQWTTTHYYTQPGSYDINIKLFHTQPPGNEGAFDASFTGTDIGVSSTIGLSLSLASPQVLGTSITATAIVAPTIATGTVQFQVQTPGSSSWSTFDTKTLPSPPTVTSNSYQFASNPGVYKFRAVYSGDSLLKSSQSPELSIQVNEHLFVTISPTSATIAAGASQVFTATPGSGSGTYTNFAWTVDGNPVPGNSQSYTFTSQNAGSQTITVTVTDSLSQTAQASATCTVTSLSLDHITISPMTATITVGGTQQYSTEGFDIYGNDLGPINDAIYSASTGTTVIGNSVSATIAGTYKVTATYEGKTSPEATLTVIPGDSSSVSYFVVVASPSSVVAGGSVGVVVTAKDQYGNTVPSYAGTAGLTCSDVQAVLPVNVVLVGGVGSFSVTLRTVGSQTVTATAGSISGTSNSVTVTPGDVISVTIAPKTQTIVAGDTQAYTATASDGYNMWDVTSLTTFSIQSGAGGSWTANAYTSAKAGTWTVTGVYQTLSDTASLTVTTGAPDTVTHFIITNPPSTAANVSFSITVLAKDAYENTVTSYNGPINFNSDDPIAKYPLNPSIANGAGSFSITLINLGSRQINVAAGSNTGSATINVIGATVSGYVFNDINANGIREIAEVGLADWTIKLNSTITITTDSTGFYEFINLPLANYVITETSKSGWILTSNSDLTLSVQAGQTYGENNFGNVEATAIIRGTVFNDANSNGYKDFNELGLNGWTLNLNQAVNVVTDNNGFFAFIITSPPSICVVISYDEAGWRPTTPSIIHIQTQSGGLYELEFGKTDLSGVAAIYGYVFNDVNGNGVWDTAELGLEAWTVEVTQGSSKITTTTGPQGFYLVTLETSGYYSVSTATQAGWRATSPETINVNVELGKSYQADFAYQNPTIDYITIAPKTVTVNAGVTQQFTVTATDIYGNSWTVIADYSSTSADVVIFGDTAYSNKAGTYIITGTYGGKSDAATLTVIGHLPDAISISISPKTSAITAGTTQTYTVTASDANGNTWDVTSATTFSIQTGAEGSWSNNIYTSAKAGTWTVTGNYQTVSDTALLTVTHSDDPAELASLSLSPASASVAAGQSQSYAATATDTFGNSWIVTGSTLFSIDASAGGSWGSATYTAEKAGVWTVTGIYLSKSATAILTVTHSDDPTKLDYITIAPKSAIINAGETQSYSAIAFDTFGNSWAITATYSCSNPSVILSGNIAFSNIAGSYQITGAYGGKTDSATLTVIGQLPTIVSINVTPSVASVTAGNSQIFTATATDGFVTWDVTGQVTWTINTGAGGSWSQATGTYTSQIAGTWIVKATLGQLTDTALLEVQANSNELGQISIDPKYPITRIGIPQSFIVTAYDKFGNLVGDVTGYASFSAPGASIVGNEVTGTQVGTFIVTATYAGLTDIAVLTVIGDSVTFKAEGLPLGTNWTITFDGKDYYSTTDQIIITDLSGTTYSWSTPEGIIQGQTRFEANQTSGSIVITQVSTQTIKYSIQFLVSYTSTGNTIPVTMPAAEWVNVNGGATGVFLDIVQNSQGNAQATYMGDNRTQAITSPTTITATYQMQYLVKYQTTGNGLPVTVPVDQWVNSGENATGAFPPQIATQNTRSNLLGDNRTIIVQPTTILASYQTQYYITISSAHGTLSQQSQWVNAGSNLTVSVTSPDGDAGHRYVALGYSLDGNPTISGTAYQFTNIQASHSIQFVWQEQYYLTVNSLYGTTIGSGWYNSGATAAASLSSSVISGGSGTQFVFTNWSGDASGSSSTSNQIIMNAPKTAIANWKTQYYLTVTSAYGSPSGQGWYDSGSSATISISSTVDSGATRYIFKGWSGNGYTGNANTAQIQVSGPTTETASWQIQYLVSYKVTGNAISISLPANEWVNSGETAKGQFIAAVANAANDTRCLFLSDNRPSAITKPTEISANYQTQFLVQFAQEGIKSDATGLIFTLAENGYNYLEMPAATWINKDTEVTFNFTKSVASTGFGQQYVLTGVNATSPLTVVAPTEIKGLYESQTILFTVAGSALLLFLLLLLLFLIVASRRRRKRKQEQNANTASQPSAPAP